MVYIVLTLELTYLVIWTYALYFLFTNFKATARLLPNKTMFIVHGLLLGVYLLLTFINESASILEYYELEDISGIVSDAIESATFIFVVYSLVPLTRKQKEQT